MYLPCGHSRHSVDALVMVLSEYKLYPQTLHSSCLFEEVKAIEPTGQGDSHSDTLVEPFAFVELPAGHDLQELSEFNPVWSEYVPTGHNPSQ